MNNFKELEKLLIADRTSKDDLIKSELTHTTGVFRYVGDLVNLYMPRMIETLVGGGKQKVINRDYPNKEQ